jgi:hypothetical protein
VNDREPFVVDWENTRYWVEVHDDNKATSLLRAVGMFAYAEIWEGDENWRETLHTVPELDGAGGSVDFLKLRPEDVERVKAQISGSGKSG